MGRLEGKVAVVTGANSGIGLATAKRFAREGAQLFVTGRRRRSWTPPAVRWAGTQSRRQRRRLQPRRSRPPLRDRTCEAGVIDILFANAGVGEFPPLQEITEEHFDRTFATNVKGTLFTVKKALPLLRDGRLTSSSPARRRPIVYPPSASTARARRQSGIFARGSILDLAPRRIRINVLVPGATFTPGWHALAPTRRIRRWLRCRRQRLPWGEWESQTKSLTPHCSCGLG